MILTNRINLMNKKYIIEIIILLCVLFSAGCAFIGGGTIGNITYTSVKRSNDWYWGWRTPICEGYAKSMEAGINRGQFTMAEIEAICGKPDEIIHGNENITKWEYRRGIRWKGINLMLILPLRIPIAVPVGRNNVTFIFENGKLAQYSVIDDHWCITYVGFNIIPLDPEGKTLGFHYETACEVEHKGIEISDAKCNLLFYSSCYPKGHPGL